MKQTFSVNYDDIEHKLEVLQKDMEEINSLLNEMKTDLLSIYGKSSSLTSSPEKYLYHWSAASILSCNSFTPSPDLS